MGKIWKAFSGLADVIQVASFGGLTLGGVVAAITAIAGYSSQLPWFWILVAAALLAWTAIFLFDRFHLFERAMVKTPTPPAISERVVEYVPINDVAVEVYGKTRGTGLCNFIESVATRNGKLGHSSVLDVCATYIADTTVSIFGKHPPSIEWEKLDRSIFKTGRFENGSFHRHGNDDAEFTEISILASDRDTAVNQIIVLAAALPVARSVEQQWAEHDAAFKIASLSKGDARKELWRLREEGVPLRNEPVASERDYPNWKKRYEAWRNEVLLVAEQYDENLRPRIEVLNEMRPPPKLPSPAINPDHTLCRAVFSEILRRIEENLP